MDRIKTPPVSRGTPSVLIEEEEHIQVPGCPHAIRLFEYRRVLRILEGFTSSAAQDLRLLLTVAIRDLEEEHRRRQV